MYPFWYYKHEKKIKCATMVAVPMVAFIIGLLLPSPFSYKGQKMEDLVFSDTVFYCDNGARYEGKVLSGTRTRYGYGRLSFSNGTVYEGEWKEDKLPYGTRISRSSEYRGRFNEELQNDGFGIIEYSDEYISRKTKSKIPPNQIIKKYVGNWKEDSKDGVGRSFMADGSIEFGIYRNGVIDSPQVLHDISNAVYGIDVSHYQTDIDWNNLAFYCDESGNLQVQENTNSSRLLPVTFVYLKATEGVSITDKTYSVRSIEADRHGIVKGAYHFFHLKSDIDEQVKKFIETVSWVEGDLPPALDIECDEEIKEMGDEVLIDMTMKWLTAVEAHYHVKPIIYAREEIMRMLLRDSRFKDYMFWIAKPSSTPSQNWTIWQLSHKGKIRGCNGYVDINKFNGDYSSFEKIFNTKK